MSTVGFEDTNTIGYYWEAHSRLARSCRGAAACPISAPTCPPTLQGPREAMLARTELPAFVTFYGCLLYPPVSA